MGGMGIMGTNGNGWEEMGLSPFKEGCGGVRAAL